MKFSAHIPCLRFFVTGQIIPWIYRFNKHNWQILHMTAGGNSWWVLAKGNTFKQLPVELAKEGSSWSSWSWGYEAKNLSLVLPDCHLLTNVPGVPNLTGGRLVGKFTHQSWTSWCPKDVFCHQESCPSTCGDVLAQGSPLASTWFSELWSFLPGCPTQLLEKV